MELPPTPPLSPELILAGAAAALSLILFVFVIVLFRKLRIFTAGQDGKSLQSVMEGMVKRQGASERFQTHMEQYLSNVEDRLRTSVRSVEMVRFTPFKGREGGGQSFAASLLNENGDGLILSSLFVRDRTSVYAKPVKNGVSVFEASEEEKEALGRAKAALKQKS